MIEMANKNYGDWFKYLPTSTQNFLQGGNYYSPVTVQPPTANYQFSFERPNNNGGSNWQNALFNRNDYNPVTSTHVQPTTPTAQTPQPQTNNNGYDAYLRARQTPLFNLKVDSDLPTDQDVLNNYNEWRKNNPNAAGQDWKMQLANGVTLTEENVNNILNPYGAGRPEGVPAYVPEEFEVMNRNLLAMRYPKWSEAQYQQALTQNYPEYTQKIIPTLLPRINRQGR